MKKINKYILTIAFLACYMSTPANAVGLKENSIIIDSTIKLGDIFYDLPRNEERVLGTARNPGKEMVIKARTLLRIAIAMDLSWRPSSPSDYITLRREATIIEQAQIKEAIYSALYDEGINGDYKINIPAQYSKIILPHNLPAKMVITKLTIDASRKNFEATIAAPSAENPVQHLQIKGQIQPVITVPVLLNNVQHGNIITKNNITYIKIIERKFSRDTIADAQELIGMTARRIIIAGRPIKSSETIAPQIIERGELVTLSLNSGVMNLTTQVKALQNGAKGDVIRVVNTLSNKTLQAIVINESEVAILQN